MTEGRWYSTTVHRHLMTWLGAIISVLGILFFIGGLEASREGSSSLVEAWIWGIGWTGGGILFLVRGRRSAVRPMAAGLDVRNMWKTYFYPWDDIVAFRLRPNGGLVSVGLVLLRSGLERPMAGVRTWARSDQEPLIDELTRELWKRRAPSRPDR